MGGLGPVKVVALLVPALVVGCATTVHNRIVVGGRSAFAPESPRAPEYRSSAPDPHQGLEREIVDSLVRLSPTPLRPDGLLHALAETLFHELGDEPPSEEVLEFATRWHGLTEMRVQMAWFEAWADSSLAEYVATEMRAPLSTLPEDRIRPNRVAVVVHTARGRRGAWMQRALVLLSDRYCELEPLAQRVAVGARVRLRGRVLGPFVHPEVVITRADGRVERRPVALGQHIDVDLPTDASGALQVEVVGSFEHGPKVLANFPLWVGERPPSYSLLERAEGRTSANAVFLEMIRLVNEERTRHGLRALAVDPLLGQVALRYSEEMHEHRFFGHVSPRSGAPQDRAERAGYQGFVGENITSGSRSAREAHGGLMASPGHAANVLDPEATHLGVGVVGFGPATDRRYVVTELFGHLSHWASWSLEERANHLTELAARELGLDASRLDELLAPPRPGPGLSSRAVGALRALALVEMSRGRLDRAETLLQRARAPLTAVPLLAEIARRRASDPTSARNAVVGVLRQSPPGYEDRHVMAVRRYPTVAEMDARLRELQLLAPTLWVLSEAIEIPVVWRPTLEHRDLHETAVAQVRAENERTLAARRRPFPALDLTGASDAAEVVVGVWARGVRAESFPGRLFTSPIEQPNGRDDDGNGQIDDVHGVVATTAGTNMDLLGAQGREAAGREADLRGVMENECGQWTADAQRIWRAEQSSRGFERAALDRSLEDVAGWALGTHGASVLLEGNPFARLAVFRSQWRPVLTDEALVVDRRHVEAIADFVRRHRVRVVLTDSAQSLEDFENDLRHGDDLSLSEGAVHARARVLLDRALERWRWLLAACADTLFVVPSGNGDESENGEVPTTLDAPNLVIVGSVDALGYPATCPGASGGRVTVHDLGVGVEGAFPSGARVPLPGTARSAARVASTAAKLIALDPSLTPARTIAAIVQTADPVTAPYAGRIANAERAAAQVRRGRRPPGR